MNPRFRSTPGGFTLIEMMITLCVFLLLAGAIFSIFGATLQSASALQENQNREDSAQALAGWLRRAFLELPSDAVLVSYHRPGQAPRVSGIIWGYGNNLRALDSGPQANGQYVLRLASYRETDGGPSSAGLAGAISYNASVEKFRAQILNDDSGLGWRPLIRDLKNIDWRFRVANSPDWTDSSLADKPLFVELAFQPAGMIGTVADDFWIPPVQSTGNLALPALSPSVSVNR